MCWFHMSHLPIARINTRVEALLILGNNLAKLHLCKTRPCMGHRGQCNSSKINFSNSQKASKVKVHGDT